MTVLHHGDLHVALEPGETALDALLRGGVDVPNSCRAGACQSCRLRASAGTPPPASGAPSSVTDATPRATPWGFSTTMS